MENLVIVESPNKVKTISKYLGKDYMVMASLGHIRDLPKDELGIDIDNKFQPKYIITKPEVVKKIKEAAKNSKEIYLASDPDREGEAIAWHLYCILKDLGKSFKRVEFQEITQKGIQKGINNARNIDYKMVDSQQARRLLDRIVGYEISPVLWNKLNMSKLSAGRVQSVAVRMVCERQEQIDNFIPEEYWRITAILLTNSNEEVEFDLISKGAEKITVKTEDEAQKIIELLSNNKFNISSVECKKKQSKPHAPYTTSTYQADMSAKLNIAPKQSMEIAQALFEGLDINNERVGLITYHRTDSVRVSEDFQKETLEFIRKTLGEKYVPQKPQSYNSKENIQDAHECIRPTSLQRNPKEMAKYLTGEKLEVYKLIYYRYVASQIENAMYDTKTIFAESNGYTFKASGRVLLFDGHLRIYKSEEKDQDEEKQIELPNINKDDILKCNQLNKKQKFTQPPPYYTEASLITELEKRGIGRPSTYASIISNIMDKYIEISKPKKIKPTQIGVVVNDMLVKTFPTVLNIEFTKNVEESLDVIAEGKLKWQEYLSSFYDIFSKELSGAKAINISNDVVKELNINSKEVIGVCPECGKDVIEDKYCYVCSRKDQGCGFKLYKEDKYFWGRYKKKLTKTLAKAFLKNKKVHVKDMVSPTKGSKFDADVELVKNDKGYWGFNFVK